VNEQPDDSEPTLERQAELKAAYERNMHGLGHFGERVLVVRTRGELLWLMHERGWSGEVDDQPKAQVDSASSVTPGLCSASVRKGRALLMGVRFRRTNLRGVHLYMAGLLDASFEEADLSGAILIGADLQDTAFMDANLEGAHLAGAYLTHANLRGANLRCANLVHADLSYAGLCSANLRGADLFGADLTHTHLTGTDVRGADLRTSRFDEHTKFDNMITDAQTRLAWGMCPPVEGTEQE
jgi:uncharacterized protein YjbI with pentapeptide repeats